MAQAVGRRPVTAETLVWSQVRPCEICGILHTYFHLQKEKQTKSENLPKAVMFWKSGTVGYE